MLTTQANNNVATITSSRSCPKKIYCSILSAMPEELAFLQKHFASYKIEIVKVNGFEFKIYDYFGNKILVSHTGFGTTFASSVVTLICQYFSPEYMFFTGTAGGIKAGLKLRDVVIIEKAFEAEIQGAFEILRSTPFESCLTHPLNNQLFPQIFSADEKLLKLAGDLDVSDITIHKGTVVSSNTFPAPKEMFAKIKREDPYTIDMETSAFYQIAWLLNARVLAIRGVSNILNHDGTDDALHESDVEGSAEAAAKVLIKLLDSLIRENDKRKVHEPEMRLDIVPEAEELIKRFKMQIHPEGGYYVRSYHSSNIVKSVDKDIYHDETRKAGTAIYYLLTGSDFSAWHSLKSDELWHYYLGSPIRIHVIDNQGCLSTHILGNPIEYSGASFQIAIRSDEWFCAELVDKSSYGFAGCTVNPGFEFKDFALADRKTLSIKFPQHDSLITQFTRMT